MLQRVYAENSVVCLDFDLMSHDAPYLERQREYSIDSECKGFFVKESRHRLTETYFLLTVPFSGY